MSPSPAAKERAVLQQSCITYVFLSLRFVFRFIRRHRGGKGILTAGGLDGHFADSLTVMLFSTFLTPSTFLARSPARFFWSLELTNPLNWTTPLNVCTFTSPYLYCESSDNAFLTREDLAGSSMCSPVLCVERSSAQPGMPQTNATEPSPRINANATDISLLFPFVFFITALPFHVLLVYRHGRLFPQIFHRLRA